MDTTTGVEQDAVPAEDGQVIEPWEKTDEALDAAAELMPVCPDGDDAEGESTDGDADGTVEGGDA
ncbi:hypothetical protein OOJ91_34285 [Micromonospora lupini]|uniref:hypothetical protein n=1 Tax=Micromonospora lupini TaxID=285679 RepID=UPI00225A9E87|nr:hypothetical protein [Micromonospora lupini]MCX5070919.1 hypothetical protein [Micromonospora lupini]